MVKVCFAQYSSSRSGESSRAWVPEIPYEPLWNTSLRCQVEEAHQYKGLNQVGVSDHAVVRDADILALLHHLINRRVAIGPAVTVAVHWGKPLHIHLQNAAKICTELQGNLGNLPVRLV